MFKKRQQNKNFTYPRKELANPYFKKKSKKIKVSKIPWRIKVFLFEILALVILILSLFYYSSLFDIDFVEISGHERILPREIEQLVWEQANSRRFLIASQNNLFLFNEKKLQRTFNQAYALEEIVIKKKIPNKLLVHITEKRNAAIWHELEKYYYIDNEGTIIKEVDPLEISQSKYPLIENRSTPAVKDTIIESQKENIQYAIKLHEEFKNTIYNFQVERFIIDHELNTIKMSIVDGPQIYFITTKEISDQIIKLTILIKEKLKEDFSNKTYIDLRYGDRVYYR